MQLGHMLNLVSEQLAYQFANPLKSAELICLTARRWMGAIAKGPEYADVETITETIRREKLLPRARGLPFDEAVTKSPNWHEQCALAIERLSTGRPISRLKGDTGNRSKSNPDAEVFRAGKGKFQWARPAKDITDPYWMITHSVWQRVENSINGNSPLRETEARAALVVLFQAIFGIVQDDIQSIRINEMGGPFSVFPAEQKAILHIGSGYYPAATCFHKSDLPLPLPIEIRALLEASNTKGVGCLLDLWTPTGWRETVDILCAMPQTAGYSTKPSKWSAHRIHREVGILYLHQSITEICLIEGRDILSFRGPCCYSSIPEDKAQKLFDNTYQRTRELLGFSRRELPCIAANSKILHGRKAKSYRNLVDRLRADIERTRTHNQVMACIERLMRLLGLRKSALHANPAQYVRRFPENMLLVTDKMVGDSAFPHWLWLSPELWKLIDTLDVRLGVNRKLLPYMHGTRVVSSDELTGMRRQQMLAIVEDEGFSRGARIACRMALRDLGAGDDVCGLILGHAPVCGPLDYERPDSLVTMCAASRHYLSQLYNEYGANEIASSLTQKIERYFNRRAGTARPAMAVDIPQRFSPSQRREHLLPLWTKSDDKWFSRLWDSLAHLSHFPEHEQAQRTLLFIVVALECGVPTTYLQRFQGYYSLRNFLRSEATKRSWFLAITGDCDKGGLSQFSVELDLGGGSVLWRFVMSSLRVPRKAGDRGCRRGMNWSMFEGVTSDDIGRCVRKLLFGRATGAPMTNTEAVDLLERCSRVRSRYLHAGYVAGVMSGALREVLNHFHPADVIKYRSEVSDICLLDGTPFESATDISRMTENPWLCEELEKIAWNASLNESEKAAAAWTVIVSNTELMPSRSWLANRFISGQSHNDNGARRDTSRAYRIADGIVRQAEKQGQLKLSNSLRLPKFEDLACRTQLQDYLRRCRPKNIRKETPEKQIHIRNQIYFLGSECLALIACFGLRTTEALRLVSERNGMARQAILRIGNAIWCTVRGTKTKNAKRVARSYFCPWPEILDELLASLAADCPAVFHHTKDRIKNAAEHIDGSLHQMRHWHAVAATDQILKDHYLTGNALLVLEAYSRNDGHGSMALTFQSYTGTTMDGARSSIGKIIPAVPR